MRRPALQVDVVAVRLIGNDDDLDAQSHEQLRRDRRRGAVGAINRQLEGTERCDFGEHHPQVIEVRLNAFFRRHRARFAAGGGPGGVGQDRLDVLLDGLGELLPAAGEQLDAVVFEWIVRGGDHDPGRRW